MGGGATFSAREIWCGALGIGCFGLGEMVLKGFDFVGFFHRMRGIQKGL